MIESELSRLLGLMLTFGSHITIELDAEGLITLALFDAEDGFTEIAAGHGLTVSEAAFECAKQLRRR